MLSLLAQHYAGIVLYTLLSDQAISILQSFSNLSDPLNRLFRIGIDSSCHAAIASLMWSVILLDETSVNYLSYDYSALNRVTHHFRKHQRQILSAGFLGSAIDLDHFIAARSLRLFDAVHLTGRPFGHSVLVAICVILIFPFLFYPSRKDRVEGGSFLTSTIIGHLLRDSSRRGLLFWGSYSTPALPTVLVFALYALLMVGLKVLVHSFRENKNNDTKSQIYEKIELV